MKTIDKLIIEEYNEKQKYCIGNRVGIIPREINKQYKTHSWKWFLSSKASFGASILILMFSAALFILNMTLKKNPATYNSPTDIYLEINTLEYIKTPVKTVLVGENDLIIAVYYGISENMEHEALHYLLFEVNSDDPLVIQTMIESEGVPAKNFEYVYEGQENNFYVFELDEDLIEVFITIDEVNQNFSLDLTEYYQFLINK
ncbi:MAG: hypothetical protein AB7T03_05510 [Bacilli bacterium]